MTTTLFTIDSHSDFDSEIGNVLRKPIKSGQQDEDIIKIAIKEKDLKAIFFKWRNRIKKSESFYLTAIKNLIKQNNLCELSMQLSDMNMTEESEEEFQTEIEQNPEKYVIELKETVDEQDLFIIADIVNKLGLDVSVDAVAEMFSLDSARLSEEYGFISHEE